MLNLEVTLFRYGSELPVEKQRINDIDELNAFIAVVLESDGHYVRRIHCPDIPKTFEIVPFDYYNEFLDYARDYLSKEVAQVSSR